MLRLGPMNTPEEIKSILAEITVPVVCSPHGIDPVIIKIDIDRRMKPILAGLFTLGPADGNNPIAKQLFDWLVDPKCSAQEFNYILGPLAQHVYSIMEENSLIFHQNGRYRYGTHLGKIAAEALAKKNPILNGHWEYTAWFVVRETSQLLHDKYGFASDCLTDWLIRNIIDPDICPNIHLRIELIYVFHRMVHTNDCISEQVFASVISAISSVDINCLLRMPKGDFHYMDLHNIIRVLHNLTNVAHYIDKNLCDKILGLKTLRLTAEIHDYGYHRSLIPINYAEPKEINVLATLVKALKVEIRLYYKRFQDEHIYPDLGNHLMLITESMHNFIKSFKFSVQNPQLFDLTTSCIMDVMEYVVLGNAAYKLSEVADYEDFGYSLYELDDLLRIIILPENTRSSYSLDTDFLMSPVGSAISQYYNTRIISIRNQVKYAGFEDFFILDTLFPRENDDM